MVHCMAGGQTIWEKNIKTNLVFKTEKQKHVFSLEENLRSILSDLVNVFKDCDSTEIMKLFIFLTR